MQPTVLTDVPEDAALTHRSSRNIPARISFRLRLRHERTGPVSAWLRSGCSLPRGPKGQVGAGLGMTTSTGTVTLVPPTKDITATGQEEVIDGVRIVFQMTPGTEAPSEMNFYFPEHRALCMAENATHTLHNILTLRGALVRDAHVWARYLNETITLFGHETDVAFTSHHWPMWGGDRITEWLTLHADTYGYLHDQTLRMLNQGYTGIEIAEMMQMPPALEKKWNR